MSYKEEIIFNKDVSSMTIATANKPMVYINKIIFSSHDSEWVNRLFEASLIVKTISFDSKNEKIKVIEEAPITFGQYISPYHKQAVLEVNSLVIFEEKTTFSKHLEPHHWETTIRVNNLTFLDNETLTISFLGTEELEKRYTYYKNRVKDWKKRISDLYENIRNWLSDFPKHQLILDEHLKIKMYEKPMQDYGIPPESLDIANLYINEKLIFSFEPIGLWTMGANGRIDIISSKGSYTLVDKAEAFKEPKWFIYMTSDKRKGVDFNRDIFIKILNSSMYEHY